MFKNIYVDEVLLDVYDDMLVKYGSYIYILCRDFIKKIVNIFENMYMNLINGVERLLI